VKQQGKGLSLAFPPSRPFISIFISLITQGKARQKLLRKNTTQTPLDWILRKRCEVLSSLGTLAAWLLFEFPVKATCDVVLTSLSDAQHVISFEGSN
jgi:hypothetical protein